MTTPVWPPCTERRGWRSRWVLQPRHALDGAAGRAWMVAAEGCRCCCANRIDLHSNGGLFSNHASGSWRAAGACRASRMASGRWQLLRTPPVLPSPTPISVHVGNLYFAPTGARRVCLGGHAPVCRFRPHAIGDAAIEQLLLAFERALQKEPRADHRHRIEHFSLPTASQIERLARLGVRIMRNFCGTSRLDESRPQDGRGGSVLGGRAFRAPPLKPKRGRPNSCRGGSIGPSRWAINRRATARESIPKRSDALTATKRFSCTRLTQPRGFENRTKEPCPSASSRISWL